MVTRRIRSEYMKKFKDPKWESYSRCYEEMLKYRLTRRLLEHTHNPWFWAGSDTDSDSGGGSPPGKSQAQAESGGDGPVPELEACDGGRMDGHTDAVPRLPLQEEEEDVSGHQAANNEKDAGGPPQVKTSKSSKPAWRSQRVRPAPAPQPRKNGKDSRHPFALYGSGEKDADIAERKTHNVGPAASTNEIHVSALRAKTRREVERQFQTQRERRRAKSADVSKTRNVVEPDFNPWITEYMRCFSARCR
ncbi:centriole, cilia and spindle-associated protein isoform X2 [Antennarius striatus]|uniref:centriole, cilia and spindle-associated protein isoform X2 n=1 Tax=Antennarius striatus TaxID=241820 RepID=UPI0035B0FE5B